MGFVGPSSRRHPSVSTGGTHIPSQSSVLPANIASPLNHPSGDRPVLTFCSSLGSASCQMCCVSFCYHQAGPHPVSLFISGVQIIWLITLSPVGQDAAEQVLSWRRWRSPRCWECCWLTAHRWVPLGIFLCPAGNTSNHCLRWGNKG